MEQGESTLKARTGKPLNKEERRLMEVMNNKKMSTKEIALLLGRSQRTIQRELQRGKVQHRDTEYRYYITYSSDRGQAVYEERCLHRGYKSKIEQNAEMYDYVSKSLKDKKWSPDIISNRMELDIGISVCTKTIYNCIDKGVIAGFNNGMLLEKPYRRKRSKKFVLRKDKRCPERKSIEERPQEVETREEFGHWEIDLVVGKRKGSGAALLTLTERKTRLPIIVKLPDQKQNSVTRALNGIERQMGAAAFREKFKSITADNGSEFLNSESLEKSVLSMQKRTIFYYAHPYASWERGSNENMNRMIRRFIPKGSDIGKFTKKQIRKIEDFLSHYPRKIIDYKTPMECYKYEIA